jgi:hypothetical protein
MAQFQPADPVLPIGFAANELGVCTRTLKRYHALGLLEFIKLSPRRLGVRRSELTRFVNERACRGVKAAA